MIIDNLPFDKYELEPSPLTLFILGRKQPNYCWQVFIQVLDSRIKKRMEDIFVAGFNQKRRNRPPFRISKGQ